MIFIQNREMQCNNIKYIYKYKYIQIFGTKFFPPLFLSISRIKMQNTKYKISFLIIITLNSEFRIFY